MMDAAGLREWCVYLRSTPTASIDDAVIDLIETEVEQYRAHYYVGREPAQLPPEPLLELLPLTGWLIYEASWNAVRQIDASFQSAADGPERTRSEIAYHQVNRLAEAARQLPWPEFAPRALGAIRSQALAESKRDTEESYDLAWHSHRDADKRYRSYLDSLGDDPARARFVLALDEVLLQLALAETGTACRTAERVVGRWAEEYSAGTRQDEERWVQRIYRDVTTGADIGARALATAQRIKDTHGLVHTVTEERMALVTGYRNPGIMCARAALIALALCPAMEDLGRLPANGLTWRQHREALTEQFVRAYRATEQPVTDRDGEPVPWDEDHQRALVQLRLNLALLRPGYSLPSEAPFDPCLEPDPLDGKAIAALSGWLAPASQGSTRVRGSMIGSATMPLFVQSALALRSLTGDPEDYLEWRRDWFELGRYSNQPGRRDRVEAALREAASRPSLRIRGE
ncbi:hypothetical protein [Cryptosporangium sp. NPDC051539]|uniref:hypothetical protein n=1 Tax=Cryptosporangium sp. NPDC051539 TaxID=3363962 RepID=UPI0037B7A954